MNDIDYFKKMARYNQWMNERLYALCDTLPDAVRKQDMKAFFRSIHGTLNHLLLVDKLWLARLNKQPCAFRSLDQELYGDFAELWRERRVTDAELLNWVEGLTEQALAGPCRFTSMLRDGEFERPLWHVALHLFNHQTHHRGQATTLLMQCGHDPGVTDLLWMP